MLRAYTYQGHAVTFNIEGEMYINATEKAKPFGKKVVHFLKLKSTIQYIEVLESEVIKTHFTQKGNFSDGREQGTWMHELLAIEFAGWLAPQFKLWCNKRIREILQNKAPVPPLQREALANQIEAIHHRLNTLEQHTATASGAFLTVRQYAIQTGVSIPHWQAIQVGKRAREICEAFGYSILRVPDQRFGYINSYPVNALHHAYTKQLS